MGGAGVGEGVGDGVGLGVKVGVGVGVGVAWRFWNCTVVHVLPARTVILTDGALTGSQPSTGGSATTYAPAGTPSKRKLPKPSVTVVSVAPPASGVRLKTKPGKPTSSTSILRPVTHPAPTGVGPSVGVGVTARPTSGRLLLKGRPVGTGTGVTWRFLKRMVRHWSPGSRMGTSKSGTVTGSHPFCATSQKRYMP